MWLFSIFLTILIVCLYVKGQNVDLTFNLDDIELEDNYLDERADKRSFDELKKIHNKIYLTKEENEIRFKNFRINLRKIRIMNVLEQGTAYYKINKFFDFTTKEFLDNYTGLKIGNFTSHNRTKPKFNKSIKLPYKFDWREKGAVTDVKDQGMCGSCYAFSAIGNVEGINKIVNGDLINLSEEEIIDCDTTDFGCNGGYMNNVFEFIIKSGIETEKDYPYSPIKKRKCFSKNNLTKVYIDSYTTLNSNEKEIAQYLVQHGPISISINAAAMQFYSRGISHPFKFFCNPNKPNHGVLLVGFGEIKKKKKTYPYWIIKNSWGKKWGINGYYYVYRGDNTCGLANMASSSVINKLH